MTVSLSTLFQKRPRVPEWTGVTPELFRSEILPLNRPAVLRGVVADWPLVRAGSASPAALVDYLAGFDAGALVPTTTGPPSIAGRIFYKEDMKGLNVQTTQEKLVNVLKGLLRQMEAPAPVMIAMQAIAIPEHLPGLELANPLPLLPADVKPRAWIGNAATVAPHFDFHENIACVAAGRRRFILFPPDQVANLYVGPVDFTPAGAPVSMVDLARPDLERYPRFRDAIEAAQVAELEPGDAIFVPYLWWHGVQSLEGINLLVNYWWDEAVADDHPFGPLLHASLTFRGLPEHQKLIWRAMFDHYVFERGGHPMAHLAPEHRGSFGDLTPEAAARLKHRLGQDLQRHLKEAEEG
ncbi:MAG TPA: cupin-like domain-containing protein [Allosphingosinicella sp.]|jgi:hypothetical protein